jgi:hypothetical protein
MQRTAPVVLGGSHVPYRFEAATDHEGIWQFVLDNSLSIRGFKSHDEVPSRFVLELILARSPA